MLTCLGCDACIRACNSAGSIKLHEHLKTFENTNIPAEQVLIGYTRKFLKCTIGAVNVCADTALH